MKSIFLLGALLIVLVVLIAAIGALPPKHHSATLSVTRSGTIEAYMKALQSKLG
jgi:hypothetical protein